VRAIEHAAKATGASKIDGEAVRRSLLSTPVSSKESFGVLPNLKWTNDAPFPTSGMTINIGTVDNGKYKIAAENVPVPVLNKW
jgi:branched-chain amino acid transport system substrate-binding protein